MVKSLLEKFRVFSFNLFSTSALLACAPRCSELHRHLGLTFLQPEIRGDKVTLLMGKGF